MNAYRKTDSEPLKTDPEPNGRGVVLTFSEEDGTGKFGGHTYVNSVGGNYQKSDSCGLGDFTIFSTFATEVYESSEWSRNALNPLRGKVTYGRTEEKLYIYHNKTLVVMVFSKAK
ncbi:hypothetical protein GCM10007390_01930 [Persicitalea jodogahamensis]|uniref:Uncharacterized protein n=1 Tax=Persicitalea jodogahamensis TaxID=402147 RepID=A0A8J3D164_9BACT|nr:hypothetical protein GCM10007390_01930 [Persicitalea jodogahamensis]